MEEIKAKQHAKEEITKKCINIKEEIIEQNEQPKFVEKVKLIKFNHLNYSSLAHFFGILTHLWRVISRVGPEGIPSHGFFQA